MMPATSKKQQNLMRADLGRLERGEKTRTGMTKTQLEHFAKGKIAPKKGKHR